MSTSQQPGPTSLLQMSYMPPSKTCLPAVMKDPPSMRAQTQRHRPEDMAWKLMFSRRVLRCSSVHFLTNKQTSASMATATSDEETSNPGRWISSLLIYAGIVFKMHLHRGSQQESPAKPTIPLLRTILQPQQRPTNFCPPHHIYITISSSPPTPPE